MTNPFDVIQPIKIPIKDARSYDSEWLIEVTNNDGSVKILPDNKTAASRKNYLEAVMFAKFQATPDSHMIIIKKDGQDFQRWDRDRVVDSNEWIEIEDLDEIKIIGKVNQFLMVSFD